MKRIVAIVGLEIYAVALALVQLGSGLHTDEAKYLLNIPYPHPPLARWVLSQTEMWQFQELFWRIAFATILVQAVWFIWALRPFSTFRVAPSNVEGRQAQTDTPPTKIMRVSLCLFWLTSAGVVVLIGRIFMAPLTAVQGLIFLWLLTRVELANRYAGLVALFWLASLFTAYQAILYLPIVAVLFWKMNVKPWQKALGLLGPVALLGLYSLASPHAMLSFVRGGMANVDLDTAGNLRRALQAWGVGGSVVLSVFGTLAMVRSKHPAIASLALVFLFVTVSYRPYYAVLFTPLFIAGLLSYPQILCRPLSKVVLHVIITILIVTSSGFTLMREESIAREVVDAVIVNSARVTEPELRRLYLLISGPFGHEWQYESPWPVRRFNAAMVDQAVAVVCLEECEGDLDDFEQTDMKGVLIRRER